MLKIEQLLMEHGLYEQKEAILKESVTAIQLIKEPVAEGKLPAGSSKFGGNPDLPSHFSFPTYKERHLFFLAQINLKESKPFNHNNRLPESGILYFFYDCIEQPWRTESGQEDSFKVLYYDGNETELTNTPYPIETDEYFPLPLYKIKFLETLTFPENIETIKSEEDSERYYEFRDEVAIETTSSMHQMLGHPFNVQNDVFEEIIHYGSNGEIDWNSKELKEKKINQVLLFQMDSDDDLSVMWGDMGMLYFCMDKLDLQHKQFENVNLIMQCC